MPHDRLLCIKGLEGGNHPPPLVVVRNTVSFCAVNTVSLLTGVQRGHPIHSLKLWCPFSSRCPEGVPRSMGQHPPLSGWALGPTAGSQNVSMVMGLPLAGQLPSPRPWAWQQPSGMLFREGPWLSGRACVLHVGGPKVQSLASPVKRTRQ